MTIPREPLVEEDERCCPLCDCVVPVGSNECTRCGMPIPSAKKVMHEARKSRRIQTRRGLPNVRFSYTYMIKSDVKNLPFHLLLDAVHSGTKGMCITRLFPDIVKRRLAHVDVPVIWLSSTASDDCIRPRDLEKIALVIEKFIETGPSIILIDGIDYLITNNSFKPVLRLVQILRDQVSVHGSILLITVPPAAIQDTDLRMLEKEADHII